MKAQKDTIEAVKIAKKLIPALNKNLDSTHKEYMSGELNRGAYEYVLSRHGNACAAIGCISLKTGLFDENLREHISKKWIDKLDENIGYCLSWMCHDLRAYASIDLNNDKAKKENLLNDIKKIEEHLEKIGFTETNPFFHLKTKPK